MPECAAEMEKSRAENDVGKGVEGEGRKYGMQKQWVKAWKGKEEVRMRKTVGISDGRRRRAALSTPSPRQLISLAPRLRRDGPHPAAATPMTSSIVAARTSKQHQRHQHSRQVEVDVNLQGNTVDST